MNTMLRGTHDVLFNVLPHQSDNVIEHTFYLFVAIKSFSQGVVFHSCWRPLKTSRIVNSLCSCYWSVIPLTFTQYLSFSISKPIWNKMILNESLLKKYFCNDENCWKSRNLMNLRNKTIYCYPMRILLLESIMLIARDQSLII